MSVASAVYALVGALIALSTMLVLALIFVQDFDQIAPTVIAAVLGPLTTALSVLGGILASQSIKKGVKEEAKQDGGAQ